MLSNPDRKQCWAPISIGIEGITGLELPDQVRRALSSLGARLSYVSGVDVISPGGRRGECIEITFSLRIRAGTELVGSLIEGAASSAGMRAYVELIRAGRAGSTFRVILVPMELTG